MSGLIAIPCADQARWSIFDQCVEELDRPEGTIVKRAMGCSIAENCNLLVRYALEHGIEWVFWLNDDLVFKSDVLMRLLVHPEPIVSGMSLFRRPFQGQFYPIWSQEYEPTADKPWRFMTDLTTGENGLIPLATAATGGMLTRRTVWETLPGPYWWRLGAITPDLWCDDVDFCQRAREAGFAIWGDPSVQFGHMTHVAVWPHQAADGTWSTVLARAFEAMVRIPAPFTSKERSWVS